MKVLCASCVQRLCRNALNGALRTQEAHKHWTARHKSTSIRSQMSAWQIHQYGGNEELSLSHTAKVPTIQSPNELLIEVHGASVNPLDVKMRGGYGQVMLNVMRMMLGNMKSGAEFPLILGRDFSGVVLETGKKVTKYKPGDEVWGAVAGHKHGTHAQLVVAEEKEISMKPSSLDHIEAASIPYVAATSWSALCSVGELKESNTAGKRILVLAGSGGIGTFAIQLLRAWGAEVTTTCSSDAVDMVQGLGADRVIDYRTQDVQAQLSGLEKFDFILDPLGGDGTNYLHHLKKWRNAMYVSIAPPFLKNTDQFGAIRGSIASAAYVLGSVAKGFSGGQNVRYGLFVPNGWALKKVAQMVDNSEIQPVIEKTFNFDDLPDAYAKLADGHARGKSVIKVKN